MYAELHCHSYYSFLDGVSSPEELVIRAHELKLSGLALTDHNGYYGFVRFSQAAEDLGLPTIFGAELTIDSKEKRSSSMDPAGKHLVVLARNPEGYKSLAHSISLAQLNGEKSNPKFNIVALAEASKNNWIILTGCRKGPMNSALMDRGPRAAQLELLKLAELFGKENIFVELWNHNDPIDIERNDLFSQLAIRCGVNYVATNNVHYAKQDRFYLANLVSAIRGKKTLQEARGWLSVSGSAYLKSHSEQLLKFSRWPNAVEITSDIAAECSFSLNLVAPELPSFPVPKGYTEIQFLKDTVNKKAKIKYGPRDNELVKGAYRQIDHELTIIQELGYAGYFLIVYDIVKYCKNNNILCQGRGSAANSSVCYVLEITNVDAVSLGLLFERFLSKAREGPPDIDIDIESSRRDEVINYVYQKYGRFHAGQVANVITYRSRLATREVAKALGYSLSEIDRLSTELKLTNSSSFKEPLLSLVESLKTTPRHLGIHTGGIVLTKEPVSTICPVEWATRENRSVLQWDKDDCAAAGLVKFDLLGLRILEAIHEAIDLVKKHCNTTVDISKLPQEKQIYEMLSKGDSVGVFQVESRAQMNTLPRLKPACFYDLVIEVALIRPGPIQGGAVHPYLNRRSGKQKVTYDHETAKNSLEKTLGVPLFQEQLMRLSMDVAGFSAAQADELRSAMSAKRSKQKMLKLQSQLLDNMAKRNIDKLTAEKIVQQIVAFSGYGFPESHAISFAYLVYISAWFKFHYPEIWLTGLLNAQPMGFWSSATLVEDAKRHGVKVIGPDVNLSETKTSILKINRTLCVCLGLGTISRLKHDFAKKVAFLKPYNGLEDFAQKTNANKSQIETLASARALNSLMNGDPFLKRRLAIWNSQVLSEITDNPKMPYIINISFPQLTPETKEEQLALDMDAVKIGLDDHPIGLIRNQLKTLNVIMAKDLVNCTTGDIVKVAGLVTHRQAPPTANGTVFLNLEDETGFSNIIFSKGAWAKWKQIANNHAIIIQGKLTKINDTISITINAQKVIQVRVAATSGSRDYR
jgi:error-prone DNA polymerase